MIETVVFVISGFLTGALLKRMNPALGYGELAILAFIAFLAAIGLSDVIRSVFGF